MNRRYLFCLMLVSLVLNFWLSDISYSWSGSQEETWTYTTSKEPIFQPGYFGWNGGEWNEPVSWVNIQYNPDWRYSNVTAFIDFYIESLGGAYIGVVWPPDWDTVICVHHRTDGTYETTTSQQMDSLTLTYPITSFSAITAPGIYIIKAGWEDVWSKISCPAAYDGYKEAPLTTNLWLPSTTGIAAPLIQLGHIYRGQTIIDGQDIYEQIHSSPYNLYSYLSANNIYASDGSDSDTTYIAYYWYGSQPSIMTTLSTNSVTTILPQDNFSLTQPGTHTITWTYHDSKYYDEYFADDPDTTRYFTLHVWAPETTYLRQPNFTGCTILHNGQSIVGLDRWCQFTIAQWISEYTNSMGIEITDGYDADERRIKTYGYYGNETVSIDTVVDNIGAQWQDYTYTVSTAGVYTVVAQWYDGGDPNYFDDGTSTQSFTLHLWLPVTTYNQVPNYVSGDIIYNSQSIAGNHLWEPFSGTKTISQYMDDLGISLTYGYDSDERWITTYTFNGTEQIAKDTVVDVYNRSGSWPTWSVTTPGVYTVTASWNDAGEPNYYTGESTNKSFTLHLWLPETTLMAAPPIQPGHYMQNGVIVDDTTFYEPVHPQTDPNQPPPYSIYDWFYDNGITVSLGIDSDSQVVTTYQENGTPSVVTTVYQNEVQDVGPGEIYLHQPGVYHISWDFMDLPNIPNFVDDPDTTRTLTLVVYDLEIDNTNNNWLPTKGGTLQKTATIKPTGVAGKIKFTLYDVTAEPGYCMNAVDSTISGADDTGKDLRFEAQAGYTINGTDSTIAEKNSETNSASVNVSCFDYGAYGKVKAELLTIAGNNITPLLAHLPSIMTTQFAKIPRDDNNSFIADGWDGDATTYNDDTDSDPVGNGLSGDGLSRYEEYRGFMIKGDHTRTSPFKKDLFIFDEDDLGLDDLTASGLELHSIDSIDFNGVDNRVVNFSFGAIAHIGDQHGLYLRDNLFHINGYIGLAEGGPGKPGVCTVINIYSWKIRQYYGSNGDYLDWDEADLRAKSYVIGHEAAHGISIFHHDNDFPTLGPSCLTRYEESHHNNDQEFPSTYCNSTDGCAPGRGDCIHRIDVRDPQR